PGRAPRPGHCPPGHQAGEHPPVRPGPHQVGRLGCRGDESERHWWWHPALRSGGGPARPARQASRCLRWRLHPAGHVGQSDGRSGAIHRRRGLVPQVWRRRQVGAPRRR
ncbi:unnamed protein product, partial [Polarella glacialis]